MESSLMGVLGRSADRLKELTGQISKLVNDVKRGVGISSTNFNEIELNSAKLTSVLNKVKTDMSNYFQYVNTPESGLRPNLRNLYNTVRSRRTFMRDKTTDQRK